VATGVAAWRVLPCPCEKGGRGVPFPFLTHSTLPCKAVRDLRRSGWPPVCRCPAHVWEVQCGFRIPGVPRCPAVAGKALCPLGAPP
jgi:hypothetical protein